MSSQRHALGEGNQRMPHSAKPLNAGSSRIARAVLSMLGSLCIAATAAAAEPADAAPFVPYNGPSGYQEIALGGDAWYVAYLGMRNTPVPLVQAAWMARAAQLCASSGKPFMVELRYVGEPVFANESAAAAQTALARPVGATFIYIPASPMPGMPQAASTPPPSKMAAMRCLASADGLRPKKQAISTADALAQARQAGIRIP